MTGPKIREVLVLYARKLTSMGIAPRRADARKEYICMVAAELQHAFWMVHEADGFVERDELEEAQRQLGFIQGILWTTGICTIDEMREHNDPHSSRA